MASVLDKLVDNQGSSYKSNSWYRNNVKKIYDKATARKLMNQGKLIGRPSVGRLNLFFYDPKTKDRLPYYDRFPLVFIIELYEDGFLGMNFHYLPYNLRARLLEELDNRNFRRNYSQLKRIKLIRPTIKRYLRAHYRSGFMRLEKDDYIPAIFMPVAKFEKASESKVFADSRRMVS